MDHPVRRMLSDGTPCRPFHDVQMLVDGDAAVALGQLARTRWEVATGERLSSPPSNRVYNPWPVSVQPDLREIQVAIARTMPASADRPPVREVERLLMDLFRAARRCIYIETQYFTSKVLVEVLTDLLQRGDGPDIVRICIPAAMDGWSNIRWMSCGEERSSSFGPSIDIIGWRCTTLVYRMRRNGASACIARFASSMIRMCASARRI